jgi:hypothetical protein
MQPIPEPLNEFTQQSIGDGGVKIGQYIPVLFMMIYMQLSEYLLQQT